MAYNNILENVTLSIEVEGGVSKGGTVVYKKKNFSGIKGTVTSEQLGIVADAIKKVLSADARNTYKNSVEKIEKQK